MARLKRRTGTEGPRHDPYGYTEYHWTSTDKQRSAILHIGLGEWCEVFGCQGIMDGERTHNEQAHDVWQYATGMNESLTERAYWRAHPAPPYWVYEAEVAAGWDASP
jgi:hypothetical protein